MKRTEGMKEDMAEGMKEGKTNGQTEGKMEDVTDPCIKIKTLLPETYFA